LPDFSSYRRFGKVFISGTRRFSTDVEVKQKTTAKVAATDETSTPQKRPPVKRWCGKKSPLLQHGEDVKNKSIATANLLISTPSIAKAVERL
jgi:hypothetical protein